MHSSRNQTGEEEAVVFFRVILFRFRMKAAEEQN